MSLFGGTLDIHIPKGYTDISHSFDYISKVRQVPDNQEVFVDDLDNCLVVELLQLTEDDILFHFKQLADDNAAHDVSPGSVETRDCPQMPLGSSVSVMAGTQSIAKFNKPDAATVYISLCLYRIPEYETDILVSLSSPQPLMDLNSFWGLIASTLVIKDPSLKPQSDTDYKYMTHLSVQLNNGLKMPLMGIGTYRLSGADCTKVVESALDIGYRLIDTAAVYRNEEDIGNCLSNYFKESKLKRGDLFITSKIAPKDQGFDNAYEAVKTSLSKLKLDYLDLMLIHWPGTQRLKQENPKNTENRLGTYKALEKAYNEGLVRAIGVSNFNIEHIEHLLQNTQIVPAVNQVELHPLYPQRQLVEFCRSKGIVVQSYSTLGEGKFVSGEIELESVKKISEVKNFTRAQILLAWAMHKGYPVIPKTSNEKRLKENFEAITMKLDQEEIESIDREIDLHGEQKFCWDPVAIA